MVKDEVTVWLVGTADPRGASSFITGRSYFGFGCVFMTPLSSCFGLSSEVEADQGFSVEGLTDQWRGLHPLVVLN